MNLVLVFPQLTYVNTHSVGACVDAFRGIAGCYVRRSQAAQSRRERDVRAQAGRGAASPNHTV